MSVTPEKQAEINAEVEEFFRDYYGEREPKPKAVVVKDQVVRDADVPVSRADKNAPARDDQGFVVVRRPDYVTINMEAWEEQQRWKREDRRRRRELDPFRIGHWGTIDDDDE
jgi:hypothetical protein